MSGLARWRSEAGSSFGSRPVIKHAFRAIQAPGARCGESKANPSLISSKLRAGASLLDADRGQRVAVCSAF